MTRMVQVHGLPLVAVVTKEGFRRVTTNGAPKEVWIGFWRATVDGRDGATYSAVADTIEEACDGAAEHYQRAYAARGDEWAAEEQAA